MSFDRFDRVPNRGPQNGLLGRISQRENGGQIVLAPGAVRRSLLQLSSENQASPENVTVALYKEFLADFDALSTTLIRAHVTWGAGKIKQKLTCDLQHGMVFSLNASAIELSASYLGVAEGDNARGPSCRVSGSLTYGNVGAKNLTLTEQRITLAAGATTGNTIRVPDFARELTIVTPSPVATSIYWSNNSTDIQVETSAPSNSGVMVPNGAEFVGIENNGVAEFDFVLIWSLSL